jgi:DNA-binding transcriptional regulator YiaG
MRGAPVAQPPATKDKRIPMPNIAAVLKQEIARVARRETRSQIDQLRRITAQQRRGIAGLKRHIATLERRLSALAGSVGKAAPVQSDDAAPKVRFSPKGLRAFRNRLGLSAEDLARLIEVSSQSVYNWERKVARPRAAQLQALQTLRASSRKEILGRLETLSQNPAGKGRSASK